MIIMRYQNVRIMYTIASMTPSFIEEVNNGSAFSSNLTSRAKYMITRWKLCSISSKKSTLNAIQAGAGFMTDDIFLFTNNDVSRIDHLLSIIMIIDEIVRTKKIREK